MSNFSGNTETRSKEFFVNMTPSELELLEDFLYFYDNLGDVMRDRNAFWTILDVTLFRK